MAYFDVSRIGSWHAHVYFDAASRDAAREFRDVVAAQFGDRVQMGRFHEREVGPHPRWSFQIAFAPTQFPDVVGWLALNHAPSTYSCIPIPTMSCATIGTAHFGSAEAIHWTFERAVADRVFAPRKVRY
jgi:aromatic ring-cleaving dioxygenase